MTVKSRTSSESPSDEWQGPYILSVSASKITSNQLKQYLDRKYPGQYSVQLKRDRFTITITEHKKEVL
ncbi:hypothetical protein F5Y00DRAFT_248392 [Daldinia vernicosa]|uniref:uncharacterized protein n=1 Tax=Daldinia vernicosa TaxID=114800 RepID=UPI002008DF87|nr:uncharacterized protein F5Y00DRAFT_248392 [Daldinia vernicosa]KAI0844529.1 hypothetical protein F5Y00DRAFT_248392 [Daldinia vernicosa]